MKTEELRALQTPLKERYKAQPDAALITLKAEGRLGEGVTCNVETGKALVTAGLHPATGGDGLSACSGDMLLEALVACAGVTLNAVATAIGVVVRSGAVRAEGDLDFRGTLGVAKDAPVGFQRIRLHFDLDTDASEEQLSTLMRLTERYCVVFQTLRQSPGRDGVPRRRRLTAFEAHRRRLDVETSRFSEVDMPMYMDIHEVKGATAADVAKAHIADVKTQGKYGVEYHKYWFNESTGKIFCLCSAPTPEAAASVHREAHGLVASKIIEVAPEIADGFLGGCEVNPAGAALVPGGGATERDPGIRTVMFTDIVDSTGLTQRSATMRRWLFLAYMTRSCGKPSAPWAAARSSTPETASWRASCRLSRPSVALPGFSAGWLSTSR